jgi:hypothetical protein
MEFHNFYPGSKYIDILSLDVYGNDFNKTYYDSLLAVSAGKPVVLAEVGSPPSPEIVKDQPKWGFYVTWAGMVRNTLRNQYKAILNDPHYLNLEDSAYRELTAPYRAACGLAPLPFPVKVPADFSGEWIINEEKSLFGNFGASSLPYKMSIAQNELELTIKRIMVLEYADDRINEERLTLDGKECRSEIMNSPRITTAQFNEGGDTLVIHSKVTMTRGNQTFEMVSKEIWTLEEQGAILSVEQTSSSYWGERNIRMVYNRR